MCLVGVAIDINRRFPLVIAANRDEYHARPTARLAWWKPTPDSKEILAGRDLHAGGTWLGLSADGRLALVSASGDAGQRDPEAPSRGRIVPDWLAGQERMDHFWMRTALSGYQDFNLMCFDFTEGAFYHASNRSVFPERLCAGLYGLSSGELDADWPKVRDLKRDMSDALKRCKTSDTLAEALFHALGRRPAPAGASQPAQGHTLAKADPSVIDHAGSAFCRSEDGLYGTRSSTLVITEHGKRGLVTTVLERSYGPLPGSAPLLRRSTLQDWPDPQAFEARQGEAARAGRGRPKALATALFDILEAAPAELDGTLPPDWHAMTHATER